MNEKFSTLQECLDYIEFLKLKGKEIPQWVLDEKRRLENEQAITDEELIYSTLAAHNPYMTPEKDKVVREMTEKLLSTEENATQPCLLLGKVQCGKTDTFLSIMSLCFDKGIDIAVVLTKGTNTLTEQTITRLKSKEKGLGRFMDNGQMSQKNIIHIDDVLKLYRHGGLTNYQLNDPRRKFVIVCKKEHTNLEYLIELFKADKMQGKKVLVCDDEADFASRAYRKAKKTERDLELAKISEQIEEFIKVPAYCRYLQITATPSSLYLQPDGSVRLREDAEATAWLPRYTGVVPVHDHYIGGKQYFEDSQDEKSMYSCLFVPVEDVCLEILSGRDEWFKKINVHNAMLDDWNFAIVSYLFSAAVRSIQHRHRYNKKYYSSCLIHCDVKMQRHSWQAELIDDAMTKLKEAIVDNGNTDMHIMQFESDAYYSLQMSNQLGVQSGEIDVEFPMWEEVLEEVVRILQEDDWICKEVNSEHPVSEMINKDQDSKDYGQLTLENTLNFFVGGGILDRGITIANMLCFFYGRDPKGFQMDTVLQHARMYGSRDKEDMSCTRFFTTEKIYDVLATINEFDSFLYDYLKSHGTTVRTDEFTSIVLGYDKRIKPSAQSKYLPSQTKVLKPKQRILPVAFQTGSENEIAAIIAEIDALVKMCPEFTNWSDSTPFLSMEYEKAVKIIKLISSTFVYNKEWENEDYQWDENEMLSALEYACFDTDGIIQCLWRPSRNISRERDKSKKDHTRWIDAPDDGHNDTRPSRQKAVSSPVLMLLRQNGAKKNGWRDTPFYWPVLVMPSRLKAGIFTVNANKKFRKPKPQIKLSTIDKYPEEEILHLTGRSIELYSLLNGSGKLGERQIKENNYALFLARDFFGQFIRVERVDPDAFITLSTYNDGVFPYEIKEYKYIHLRTSLDHSGSQLLLKINEENPYKLIPEQYEIEDVVFDEYDEDEIVTNKEHCRWLIQYNVSEILEKKLTKYDELGLKDYLAEMETIERMIQNNRE